MRAAFWRTASIRYVLITGARTEALLWRETEPGGVLLAQSAVSPVAGAVGDQNPRRRPNIRPDTLGRGLSSGADASEQVLAVWLPTFSRRAYEKRSQNPVRSNTLTERIKAVLCCGRTCLRGPRTAIHCVSIF